MVVDPEVQTVSVIKTSLLFIQLQLSVIFTANSLCCVLIYPSLDFQNRLEILLPDDQGRSILDKDYLELR